MEPIYLVVIIVFLTGESVAHKNCPVPRAPKNGNFATLHRGLMVQFTCLESFEMVGQPQAICVNGNWNHDPPICVRPSFEASKSSERYSSQRKEIRPSDIQKDDTTDNRVQDGTERVGFSSGKKTKIQSEGSGRSPARSKKPFPGVPPLNDDFFSQHIRRVREVLLPRMRRAMSVGDWVNYNIFNRQLRSLESDLTSRRKRFYLDLWRRGKYPKSDDQDEVFEPTTPAPITTTKPVDPCEINNGGCSQRCKVSYGEVSCYCNPGYALVSEDGRSCEDINECRWNNGRGPCSDKCVNTRGSYYCLCPKSGTKLSEDKKTCEDVNECDDYNYGCSHICTNAYGSAFCTCPRGYRLSSNRKTCIDIDECELSSTYCRGKCVNLKGSYKCILTTVELTTVVSISKSCFLEGLRRDENGDCIDINECLDNNFGCSHNCHNLYGSAVCSCRTGYRLINKKMCKDIDECSEGYGLICAHKCINTIGSYMCECPPGFLTDRYGNCQDINECAFNNGGCSHKCMNLRGYSVCQCPNGYELDNDRKTCIDINECLEKNVCHHTCVNYDGGYRCACKPGNLLLENNQCEACRKNSYMKSDNMDSCEECPAYSHTNGKGKTSIADCLCNDGFEGDPAAGIPCTDIDECAIDNYGCSNKCVNTPGGVYCSCPNGFELSADDKTCKDIDECLIGNGGCDHQCNNTIGGFLCSCDDGFYKDENDTTKCIDIDECKDNNGGCSHVCKNYNGGYFCDCENRMRLSIDMKSCYDIVCPALPRPSNSKTICNGIIDFDRNKLVFGTKCNIICNKGYVADDNNGSVCLKDGSWSSSVPTCNPLKCPKLSKPKHGNVSPPSCHEGDTYVIQKCYYTCDSGYVLIGRPDKQCRRTQLWKPEGSPFCQENIPEPYIQCPSDVVVTLDEGKNSSTVQIQDYKSNMATENVYVDPPWALDTDARFPFGSTFVTHVATNPITNATATCTLTVEIKDIERPKVYGCPDSFTVTVGASKSVAVNWTEPSFTDNAKIESIWKSNEPGSYFGDGIHAVKYVAQDAAGNEIQCNFSITIERKQCPELQGPRNGQQNCMDWLYGRICQPSCEKGLMLFNMSTNERILFVCGADAIWKPGPLVPDCVGFRLINATDSCNGGEGRQESNDGSNICVKCPRGMYSYGGSSSCEICPEDVSGFSLSDDCFKGSDSPAVE